jgi:2-oxo-3-hexenedioate decarboxylase
VADGYAVLHDIETRRRAQGWTAVGRKIGFTNRTIWPRYGVYQPMWAHVWTRTVHFARDGKATLPLNGLVQPRIEPEVVFKLKGSVPLADDAAAVLASVEWMAPGFEIVQSHFPDWKFAAADCTAAPMCWEALRSRSLISPGCWRINRSRRSLPQVKSSPPGP